MTEPVTRYQQSQDARLLRELGRIADALEVIADEPVAVHWKDEDHDPLREQSVGPVFIERRRSGTQAILDLAWFPQSVAQALAAALGVPLRAS